MRLLVAGSLWLILLTAGFARLSSGQERDGVGPQRPQPTTADAAGKAPTSRVRTGGQDAKFPAAEYAKLLNNPHDKARDRGMRRLLNRHAGHPQVPKLLIDAVNAALQSGTVTDTTLWMVQTLGQYNQPEVIEALLGWLKDGTAGEQVEEPVFEIIQTLGRLDHPATQQALIALLTAEDPRVVILAIDSLGQQSSEVAWEPIERQVGRRDYQSSYAFRFSVLNAVSQFHDPRATDVLVAQLPTLTGQLKFRIVDHLTRTTGQPFGADAQQWAQWSATHRQPGQLPRPAPCAPSTTSGITRCRPSMNSRSTRRISYLSSTFPVRCSRRWPVV